MSSTISSTVRASPPALEPTAGSSHIALLYTLLPAPRLLTHALAGCSPHCAPFSDYCLGEDLDPDLVEQNLRTMREAPIPKWIKYVGVYLAMGVWKW